MNGSRAKAEDVVMLISEDGKRFYIRLAAGFRQHTHQGIVDHDALIGQSLGRKIISTTGHTFLVLEPSLEELIKSVKRNTQIVYPKEAGRIIFKMNIYPGRRVIEAGSGSGALTVALARYVSPGGQVYSYEARPEMLRNTRFNLERLNLAETVELKQRNIRDGFDETEVDALFLDVREPWRFLPQARAALKNGGFFGAIVPTTNQVSMLLATLAEHDFGGAEVEETFIRQYKAVPDRLRPSDIMVGHTGFLVFARNVEPGAYPPPRPRRRVQEFEEGEEDDL